MKLAKRMDEIKPFFVMEFAKNAERLEREGHKIIKLSVGEPDFGAPKPVIDAMLQIVARGDLPYTEALGLLELREKISQFYKKAHNIAIPKERIIITAGASAALLLVTNALVDVGDEVLVGDPSYPCNRYFLAGAGANVKLIPTDETSNFQLNFELVSNNWSDETKGLMIASPSNPTGTSISHDELKKLCDFVKSKGGFRIIDEIYLNLSDKGEGEEVLLSALSLDNDAIIINSFSKYFGMTGWRLGWCVVPEILVPAIERLAQNYYICASTPAQHAALAAFDDASISICEERRAELLRRRLFILERLKEMGLNVPSLPNGAFYIYIDIEKFGLNSMQFCEKLLNDAFVSITPGNDFGECGKDKYVRLSYATKMEDLIEGMNRLEGFVKGL